MGLWLRAAVASVVLASFAVVAGVAGAATVSVRLLSGTLAVSTGTLVLTPGGSGSEAGWATGSGHWTAVDSRGTGDGWHLTVSVDTISAEGLTVPMAEHDLRLDVALPDEAILTVAGNTPPDSGVTSFTPVPVTAAGSLSVASAAPHSGMGTYDLHPAFRLSTPAGAQASSYSAILTVDIASGP